MIVHLHMHTVLTHQSEFRVMLRYWWHRIQSSFMMLRVLG